MLQANKVLLILGPRRTGKTYFLREFMRRTELPYLFLNGEDITSIDLLKTRSVQNYKNVLGDKKLLIIDEAQKIPDIGTILKLMVDSIEGLMVLATSSSTFASAKRG